MKKVWTSIAASVVLLSVTAGCSSGANVKSSVNETSGTVDKAKKDITLKLSIWGDDNRKRVFEDLGKKFTEKHPNIKVEVMLIPYAEYPKKMSIMVASRTVPDVAWLYDAIIPQMRDSDQLLDLSVLSKDAAYDLNDIYASNMDIYRKNGKLYGIPFSAGPKVLFYNKKLFKEKGLKTPNELAKEGKWTYDELIKTAKALTDPAKGIYGVKFGDGSNWKDALTDTIWSFGADIFNEDGSKFLLNSPEGEKVFQMYDDMMFKDLIHPKPGDQLPFESGKIGMYRGTFSYSASARKAEGLEFDIAPMPKGPKADAPFYNGVSGYSVMKDSEHHAEAIELLKFFTDKEGIKALQSTFPPTRKSVLESAEFANLNAQPSAEGIKLAMSQPMMAGGRVIPTPTNWQQIDSKMQSMLDMLYTRNASVKQMLERMEKEVTPLLK
ncbi:ABC transporter substrate-binding protein [Paenibacillus silviterrae]|uniref:ABC transporter substrate-binding protein n=1 Tax=Paenibacillus silviterrae TaxID=3242194 RepID=UPI0025433B96|nr:sugar ABC transporter substrate-binding protein [Paenibacillus chinjuensis]